MDPHSEILTAAESFKKDDLEFRTITTLLNILGSGGRVTLDNFEVPQRHRHRLKLLVALSSLLIRDHETVAVMAKSNVSGATVVQAFTTLLSNALRDGNDESAEFALDMYSFFQSAPKIQRRFKNSPHLDRLSAAKPQFTNPLLYPPSLIKSTSVQSP